MEQIEQQQLAQGQFFQVRLDLFDGPIDLLLHLVKQSELPIEKISLAQVTSQYLACVESFKDIDLEIAGEYLVIAATLVSIKSSIVLNQPVELVADEEGNLVDPHEELLRRLKEAEIYRDGAKHLGSRELLGIDVFAPAAVVFPGEEPDVILKNHDAILLTKALYKILKRADAPVSLMTISVDSVSIVERMVGILDSLKQGSGRLEFSKVIPDINHQGTVISTFLALLELCKRQAVHVTQDEVFEEIYVVLATAEFDASKLSAEYDITSATASHVASNMAVGGS